MKSREQAPPSQLCIQLCFQKSNAQPPCSQPHSAAASPLLSRATTSSQSRWKHWAWQSTANPHTTKKATGKAASAHSPARLRCPREARPQQLGHIALQDSPRLFFSSEREITELIPPLQSGASHLQWHLLLRCASLARLLSSRGRSRRDVEGLACPQKVKRGKGQNKYQLSSIKWTSGTSWNDTKQWQFVTESLGLGSTTTAQVLRVPY